MRRKLLLVASLAICLWAGSALAQIGVFTAGGQGQIAGPVYQNSSATVSAAANNLQINAVAGKFSYLSGFTLTGLGATAGSTIQININNVSGSPLTYAYTVPTGATTAAPTLDVRFNPPLVATAANTTVQVSAPSFGTGNTNSSLSVYGFQQ